MHLLIAYHERSSSIRNRMSQMMKRYSVSALLLVTSALIVFSIIGCSSSKALPDVPNDKPQGISGTVFDDLNSDGNKGVDEPGISGIMVSNGTTCTVTDDMGKYALLREGSSVFITTPKDYVVTGQWYRSIIASNQFDFALKYTPEKETTRFTFVQMTDVHLDTNSLSSFAQTVREIMGISPAFVVNTGDIVNIGNGVTISKTQADEWFGAYQRVVTGFNMPVYNALGNHDVADINLERVPGAEPGCSKDAYRGYFGPTYYSFDWGQYHCIVLDPNELNGGKQVYQISDSQLGWLQQDLSYREAQTLLVFFHEPTTSWESQSQVLDILKQHRAAIFCGHAHQNLLMNTQGIPEQVTGALSGEWGFGSCPDGSEPGYRIVSVDGENIESIYRDINSERTIDLDLPGPIVSGQVGLTAKIYSTNGSISEVTYSIDGGEAVAMQVQVLDGRPWAKASATWDTASVAEGYHKITVTASDKAGSFPGEMEVKVSGDANLTIDELLAHFEVYQGQYVTVQGTVAYALFGPPTTDEGAGGMKLYDASGFFAVAYAGECKSPALPRLAQGDIVRVKVIPVRFSWAFVTTTNDYEGTYELMQLYGSQLPDGQKEKDGSGNMIAMRFLRLVSAGDLTKLSGS